MTGKLENMLTNEQIALAMTTPRTLTNHDRERLAFSNCQCAQCRADRVALETMLPDTERPEPRGMTLAQAEQFAEELRAFGRYLDGDKQHFAKVAADAIEVQSATIADLRALLREAGDALRDIANDRGECKLCGRLAEGGYVSCDDDRDCTWQPRDPKKVAEIALARIASLSEDKRGA